MPTTGRLDADPVVEAGAHLAQRSPTGSAGIFLSIPGMGQITAATMLAEMGEDRSRFPTADVLLAETGKRT